MILDVILTHLLIKVLICAILTKLQLLQVLSPFSISVIVLINSFGSLPQKAPKGVCFI